MGPTRHRCLASALPISVPGSRWRRPRLRPRDGGHVPKAQAEGTTSLFAILALAFSLPTFEAGNISCGSTGSSTFCQDSGHPARDLLS